MQKRPLGRTGLDVTAICLGTMTWGSQNTETEAHEQMDHALDQGVNFFDTAEMYPVPPRAEWAFRTEQYIGNWMAARGNREKIVLATKVIGPAPAPWVRDGKSRLDEPNIRLAVEDSLKRLQTDYIDLYQVHWPNRYVNKMGTLGFQEVPEDEDFIPVEETLGALGKLVEAGKIRHIGLSNETPWGVMSFLKAAETGGLPRVASVQNPYNLLNRSYEVGLSEVSLREACGLLAYSPLAGGTLTGKYLDGQVPEGSRRSIDDRKSRYQTPNADAATRAYVDLARDHGLDPAELAIAWTLTRRFVTSSIIGATSMAQLKTNIGAANATLSPEVMAAVDEINARYTYPCP